MLHEFLSSNRNEILRRCKEEAARRFAPETPPAALENGVPLFLQQVIDTLQREQGSAFGRAAEPAAAPANREIGRSAALHGAELLANGYSVDQVVREYGDVCQATTALAIEQHTQIGAGEFRTLNRCLDDAIADAVSAYGAAHQPSAANEAQAVQAGLASFAVEHDRLIDIAMHSFAAISTGSIGVTGATGALLVHTLNELRALAGRTLAKLDLVPGLAARKTN